MSREPQLQGRLTKLQTLVSAVVNCLLEAQNNVERAEWDFAETNLRKLFRNATVLQRQRAAVLREVRLARREEAP